MTTSKQLAQEARFAIHGRILRCPFGDNPVDCPFHEIRKRPMDQRIEWVESQSDEEIVQLFHMHSACMECRLEKNEHNVSANHP